jgi:peptide chain release factor 2
MTWVTWTLVHPDVVADLAELDTTLKTVEAVLDVDELRRRIDELEQQAADPELWNDQEHAQRVTSQLSHAQGELRRVSELRQRLEDLPVLYELAEGEEGDAAKAALEEADAERAALHSDVEALEVRTLLSGEYDKRDALVNIRSGAGGVDAADWAEMLMRMYIRWAEKHAYGVEVYDTSYAEEAGIKSATFAVKAPYAYGTLSVEMGTHRLVRISPFDNQGRRQTSFAEVEVLPVVETTDHIDVPETEIRVDVYRSSGPGGQSVNTTDSAVRITHIPTGIVVACQSERSQHKNRATAWNMLRARLYELELEKREAKATADAASKTDIGWGHQIRSYVLQPYQMVKDLRTGHVSGSPSDVLDGDLDPFMEASLAQRLSGRTVAVEDVE